MTLTTKLASALLALALLAGCTTFSKAPATEKQQIGGVLAAQPTVLWSVAKKGKNQTWTINGPALDAVAFFTNITDGSPFRANLNDAAAATTPPADSSAPKFSKDMTATDVVDLYESELVDQGYSQIEIRGLRPHQISGRDAFRFEYAAFNGSGLAKKGMAIGLIDPEKGLNLVIYEAAAEHYYDASLAAAEGVLGSLERI